jgi:hypothetical protein
MHCPRCGQEQVTGNLKFCSKCGLPLGWVAELIKNGGNLPQVADTRRNGWLTRANGLKFSLVWFLLLDFLLVPLLGILDGGDIVGVAAVLGFVGAILIAVLSVLFLKPASAVGKESQMDYGSESAALRQAADQNALPAFQQQRASDFVAPAADWRAPDTEELVRPGSVTEGTTRLLTKEEDQ